MSLILYHLAYLLNWHYKCTLKLLSGDLSYAAILLAIAVRLVFQLGGNQFHSPNKEFVTRNYNDAFEESA